MAPYDLEVVLLGAVPLIPFCCGCCPGLLRHHRISSLGLLRTRCPTGSGFSPARHHHGQQALLLGDPWSPGSKCVLEVCGKLPSCSLGLKAVPHLCLILFLASVPSHRTLGTWCQPEPSPLHHTDGMGCNMRCDPMPGHLYLYWY